MADRNNDPSDTPAGQAAGLRKGITSYGDEGFSLFLRKAFIKGAGYTDAALDRPVIGMASTGSAYNPCHGNTPALLEALRRGIKLAGGLPMEFPTISLHESFASPTSMYLRNLMAMDTEEMLQAQPMDAVVLVGGCDKTVPAQLMGAASAGLPAVQLITGSMLTGSHRGARVGACTDCRRYWARFRARDIDQDEIDDVNDQLVASVGTCSVMGTASTMACVAEVLGMTVPGGASPPAVTADRLRVAEESGRIAVQAARQRLTVGKILTPQAFENAMRVLLAIGGSTNAIVHLTAMAGRMGLEVDLQALDRMGRETPVLLDLKPSGGIGHPEWAYGGGLYHIACDYRLMIDNLMDLTHETYVHSTSIGQPEIDETPCKTTTEGDMSVTSHVMNDIPAPPFWRMALRANGLPDDQPVDRWQICRFTPPSHVMIEVGVALAGHGGYEAPKDKKAYSIVVDFITPETETSMWYFWGMARNFRADDRALTAQIRDGQGKIFAEDLEVLERQQKNLSDWPERELLKLNIDTGGVQARKILDRIIAAERATVEA